MERITADSAGDVVISLRLKSHTFKRLLDYCRDVGADLETATSELIEILIADEEFDSETILH